LTDRVAGPCQVCESDTHARIVADLDDYSVTRCTGCGFVYLSGLRDREVEHERYRKDQYTDGYMQHFDVRQIVAEQRESVDRILTRAGASLAEIDHGAPVLDIGCGRGFFLNEMREHGFTGELVGVDISEPMTAWGREEHGLDLRGLPIEEANLPVGHFALVTIFDVLEHVPFPREVLRQMLGLLRPGGWGIVEVPSETTLFRVLSRAGYRLTAGRLRRPLARLYHPTHVSYFTAGSLRCLLEQLGAERIAMTSKEAHVTRFGIGRYRQPARTAIRAVSLLDRALGMEAKLLCAFRRPE